MSNMSIDYSKLSNSLEKTYKLADVQHQLIKVCFDVVRFKEGNPEELWQVSKDTDGDYIVARYEIEAPETTKTASIKSNWGVSVNEASGQVNIFYKDYQVAKFAASALGITTSDLSDVSRYLPSKLAEDKSFVKSLLNSLSSTERYQVCRQFPELNQ